MTPRWLIITLLVSAALNFFLIGVGATVVVVAAAAKAHQASQPRPAVRRAALALPAGPARQDFTAAVRQATAAQADTLLQIRQVRNEAWTAMGGAHPDPAAIKAQLAQARTLEFGVRAKFDDALVDYTAKLPQDQRLSVSEEMRPQTPLRPQAPR